MKSFKVTIDTSCNSASENELLEVLTLDNAAHYRKKHVTVTELPPIPEVKMVEWGVLMSPAEICKCERVPYVGYEYNGNELRFNKKCINIGKRLELTNTHFPREFYREIETQWDFASIPVGSLIRVEINSCWMVGYYMGIDSGYLKVAYGNMKSETTGMHKDQIKSIRIIELPKDGE